MSAEDVIHRHGKHRNNNFAFCHLLFGLETVQPSQLKCLAVQTSLGDFCSPSKACQAGARCSAMSLSRVMNTLQEITAPLTGYIDYSSERFGEVEISYMPLAFKLWKVTLDKKKEKEKERQEGLKN